MVLVTNVPLGDARNELSRYVADVERTHDRVTITRHGKPAAVLISPDDLESLEETIDILSTPGALEAIREGEADARAGRFVDTEVIKRRYGIA
jgi:antitoxin YefM